MSEQRQGLFSAAEIERLMRVEFERAQRHKLPARVHAVAVDRLGQLQDLYGYESRTRSCARSSASCARRRATATSSALRQDDRLLALFPHTTPESGELLARAAARGARKHALRPRRAHAAHHALDRRRAQPPRGGDLVRDARARRRGRARRRRRGRRRPLRRDRALPALREEAPGASATRERAELSTPRPAPTLAARRARPGRRAQPRATSPGRDAARAALAQGFDDRRSSTRSSRDTIARAICARCRTRGARRRGRRAARTGADRHPRAAHREADAGPRRDRGGAAARRAR